MYRYRNSNVHLSYQNELASVAFDKSAILWVGTAEFGKYWGLEVVFFFFLKKSSFVSSDKLITGLPEIANAGSSYQISG